MKTSTTALKQLLIDRIRLLHKLTERAANERLQAELGITATGARLIAAVSADGPFSVADLARRTNLDKSQASRAADALIRRGFMRREASEIDGRLVLISLTARGHALNREVMLLAYNWDTHLCASLGDKERTLLNRAIEKAIKATRITV